MPLFYVSTGPWNGHGTVVNRPLHEPEFDGNTWDLDQRLTALEALDIGVGISNITQPSDAQIKITLSDNSFYIFSLPEVKLNYRGEWQPGTTYFANDVVTVTQLLGVYLVLLDHTSAAVFDPGANDGAGHLWYGAILAVPNIVPATGTTDQVLGKVTGADYNMSWRSSGVPRGGATGNLLYKTGGVDYANAWGNLATIGITLAALPDTDIVTPAADDMLQYVGGKWTNEPLSNLGLLLRDLGDVNLSSSIAAGDILQFNGSDWADEPMASLGLTFADIGGTATPAQVQQAAQALPAATGTVSLDPTLTETFTVTPTGAITLNAASAPSGADVVLIVTTSGASSYNITFSGNFKSTGVLATGTASGKVFTISFRGDGAHLNETARTTAM